ncbi:RNA-binding protein [Streptococcus ruminantium]|uniref:RNA-binding protein n=1 Tax=Streptococcus ruminantium TaxID=1917441 RepID=UPI0012DFB998|nr:RNA-binding protein [Streptococcus ruminantium]
MSIISLLIILFAGFLYIIIKIDAIREKHKQAQILRLNLPIISADLEQVVEMTSTVSKSKLLFDRRNIRCLQSTPSQDSHLVTFPIMLDKKPDTETEGYLTQVFLTQLEQFLSDSTIYETWSDKGTNLQFTYQFGDVLRYNNQYYLNLLITFSYKKV